MKMHMFLIHQYICVWLFIYITLFLHMYVNEQPKTGPLHGFLRAGMIYLFLDFVINDKFESPLEDKCCADDCH